MKRIDKRKAIASGLLIVVVSFVIIVIMAAPTRNIQSTIRSGSDDEQIQSLTSRINTLSDDETYWHNAYLWFIGATVIVSVALFFVQHHEASLAKERADAESELNRVKDRKLGSEISKADERAGKANERAAVLESQSAESRVTIAKAQVDAARATERAALAESHLAESNATAKLAEQHAKEADAKAEGFRLDIARANESAKKAEARAAEAKLELAKLRDPRKLLPEQQDRIIAALKQFAGQKFSFNVYPDPEPLSLLRMIDALLKSAGWERVPSQMGVIEVEAAGSTAGTAYDSGVDALVAPDNEDAVRALLALASVLSQEGLPYTAHTNAGLTPKTPKAILINVGKKP